MLSRVINQLVDAILFRVPNPALLVAPSSRAGVTVRDIFDGIDYATPKTRTNIFKKWQRKYGAIALNKDGVKLWHPKLNITTCPNCGSFHLFHTICRTCYEKVERETKPILEEINKAWGKGIIDKEVRVFYEGEKAQLEESKRIVELERPRPLWWTQNLSQKSANPFKQIDGSPTEHEEKIVRIKDDATKS